MLEKRSPINCEDVVTTVVAWSAMPVTISSNGPILKYALKIAKLKIVGEVKKMDQVVKMFSTPSELTVTKSDMHQLLRYAITDDDEETDDTFDKMEHMGMLLYVIGFHQKQLRLGTRIGSPDIITSAIFHQSPQLAPSITWPPQCQLCFRMSPHASQQERGLWLQDVIWGGGGPQP